MHNKFLLLVLLLSSTFLMMSCLKSEDNTTSVTYYGDAAISSFTITSAKRTWHVKSSKGEDSTYTKSVAYSSYPFVIDHTKREIYNVDPLPKGVNTAKVIASITALNGGYIYLKNLNDDAWTYYVGTDSLDFSTKRTIRVRSDDNDRAKDADYTVEVRVHDEMEDSVYWDEQCVNVNLASLADKRGFKCDESVYVYGKTTTNELVFYSTLISDGKNWKKMDQTFSADASVVTDGEYIYVLSDGKLNVTDDGDLWMTLLTVDADIKRLVSAVYYIVYDYINPENSIVIKELYAVTSDGKLKYSDDFGYTWGEELMDGQSSELPTDNISEFIINSSTNGDIRKAYFIGTNDKCGSAKVWMKVVDDDDYTIQQPWMHLPFASNNNYKAPALEHMTVIPYHRGLLMIGGRGICSCTDCSCADKNLCKADAFDSFYYSVDEGLTWRKDARFYLPDGFDKTNANFAFVSDGKGYMWLVNADGKVWRGRLAQAAW